MRIGIEAHNGVRRLYVCGSFQEHRGAVQSDSTSVSGSQRLDKSAGVNGPLAFSS